MKNRRKIFRLGSGRKQYAKLLNVIDIIMVNKLRKLPEFLTCTVFLISRNTLHSPIR